MYGMIPFRYASTWISTGSSRASNGSPFTSMNQIIGLASIISARRNSGVPQVIFSMSRICLPLWPSVDLLRPNAPASASWATYGSVDRSNRKLTCPSAHTTPPAHVAARPPSNGDGRLRASLAATCRASPAYSSSSRSAHTLSVSPMTCSAVARIAARMRSSPRSVTGKYYARTGRAE